MEFNSDSRVVSDAAPVSQWDPPRLVAGGVTALVDGVRMGIQVINDRVAWYKSHGRPYARSYLILVTDGGQNAGRDTDVSGLAEDLQALESAKRLVFWAFGTDSADWPLLERLSTANPVGLIRERRFDEFFRFISASLRVLSKSTHGAVVLPANPFVVPKQAGS